MEISYNLIIIAINVLVSIAAWRNHGLMDKLIFWPYEMRSKPVEFYRFITSGFIHADTMHLLFNMFTLYFFGNLIERILGGPQYLLFYVLALMLSSVSTYIKYKDKWQYRSLGASGAVAAVVFAFIYLAPWQSIYFFALLPIPAILYGVAYLAYCVYMSKRDVTGTMNHDAHLYGSLFGWLYFIIIDPSHGMSFFEKLTQF